MDADLQKQFMDDQSRFDVRDDPRRADRIEIALDKFAKSSVLGVLPPPDRCNVVPLERNPKLVDVLGSKPSQRDR